MASAIGQLFYGAGPGVSTSTGSIGRSTTTPPRGAESAGASTTMPWPFPNRPMSRRYDRQRTPDGGSLRHGSGARFGQRPGSTAAAERPRSRERPADYTAQQQVPSPLRQSQQERQAALVHERVTALEASVVALQEGHRIAHSRLSDLEAKMKSSNDAAQNLEKRVADALKTAQETYTALEKKTSEAFAKAHTEYANERSVQDRIKVIEHRILEMDELVRSMGRQSPAQGGAPAAEPRSPAGEWWREAPASTQSPQAPRGPEVHAPEFGTASGASGPAGQQSEGSPLRPAPPPANASPLRQSPYQSASSAPTVGAEAAEDPLARGDPWLNPNWGRSSATGPAQASPTTPPQPQSWQGQSSPAPSPWFQGNAGAQNQYESHNQWLPGQPQFASQYPFGMGNGGRQQYMGNQERMEAKSETLKKFSGNPESFRGWADRIIDHMSKVHPEWRRLLLWMGKTNDDLSFRKLRQEVIGPLNEPAADLAVKFEQVLVDWLPESLYGRRGQLSGGPGEENNGFIMWRRLHHDNVGLEVHIANAGVDCLREYGRCNKMSDLLSHLDGWRDLFQQYGQELEHAPNYVRSMYLDILPKELRSELSREDRLEFADWRTIDSWVRRRCMVLQTENLASINRRILTKEIKGRINAITPGSGEAEEETKPNDVASHNQTDMIAMIHDLQKSMATMAAIQKKATGGPQSPQRPGSPGRGRSPGRNNGPRARSNSNSRRLPDWGNKCFHCGSDKHRRSDCVEFKKMMQKANPGVTDPKKWKPPPGYESAIAKARKIAKAKDEKKGAVNAITSGSDTASEDEGECDVMSQAGKFSLCALRPVTRGTPMARAITSKPTLGCICAINKFEGLSEPEDCTPETVAALNEWGAHVRQADGLSQKEKRKSRAARPEPKSTKDSDTEPTESMSEARSKYPDPTSAHLCEPIVAQRSETPVIVRSEKDLPKLAGRMDALPSHPKGVAKAYRKVSQVPVKEGEVLCMVDSGSFVHAIDAENDLPGHDIEWFGESEASKGVAETACGGILRRLGLVRCKGTIDGHDVEIQWNHMKVKCPILSVLRLTKEGNEVILRNNGGEILNLKSGKRIPFFQHNGVYYLRLQVKRPTGDASESPLFIRHG